MARLTNVILLAAVIASVCPAKQQVMLSDSFLPVAMQVIAHFTDQMNFDTREEPSKDTPSKPPPNRPVSAPSKPVSSPSKPTKPVFAPNKPASQLSKPTSSRPMYVTSSIVHKPSSGGWWMSYTTARIDQTTPSHGPGLFAPVAPPKAGERVMHRDHFLLPVDHNSEYTVIEPVSAPTEEPLLSLEQTDIKPLVEPQPAKEALLPPSFTQGLQRTSEDRLLGDEEEFSDENLQYLSPTVREMLKLAHDPDDERLVADSVTAGALSSFTDNDAHKVDDTRAGPAKPSKGKLTQSNLRLQLLYDLLSREAKKQRLSDYGGFSDAVMRELVTPTDARSQLSLALARMLERQDCGHDYANNRAREMVAELARAETPLSAEVGRLQPLMYSL